MSNSKRAQTACVPDMSNESLLRVAVSTYSGLDVLVRDGAGGHLLIAMGILACQSLEACLKAYLMQEGVSASVVKGYRHDLIRLWEESSKLGLDVDIPIPEWTKDLAISHSNPYHLRYPPHLHAVGMHDPSMIVNELKIIIENVRKY